ncbi:MAG: hypothetical protein WD872_00015 [Pirellulaceae bacterium]
MTRFWIVTIVCAAWGAGGCNRPQSVPPAADVASSGESSDSNESSAPAPKEPALAASPAPAQPAAKAAADDPAGELRDLAARLVESDGAGGWRLSEKAALELEKLGPDVADRLLPLLGDQEVAVRRGAAFGLLGRFNPAAGEQAAALTALLGDDDPTVRGIGRSAVGQMRQPDQVAAVGKLAPLLDPRREPSPANRAAIARLLAALRTEAAAATEQLSHAAADDPDVRVRSAALVALAQVAPPDKRATLLTPGLADPEAAVRRVAIGRYRQLGPLAAPAAKALAGALGDSDTQVREAAAQMLIEIGAAASEPLAGQLTAMDVEVRKLALACLIRIGPDAKAAIPAIEKCLDDADAQVQRLAATALARIKQ